MRYNLFKKEPANTWGLAKEKHIKSVSLDENRIRGEYEKVFPYDYDPTIHFVHEGEITESYIIQPDFTLYFFNDKEQIEKGYKILGIGEILDKNKIKTIPSPGEFCQWKEGKWIFDTERKKMSLLSEIEDKKRKILEKGFLWNEKYQQRCRAEKDIPFIRETLENFDLISNYKAIWYFSNHPAGYLFDSREKFLKVRNSGMIFIGEVFKIESELKLKINSAVVVEDLAFNVKEEYNKGLEGFTLPE